MFGNLNNNPRNGAKRLVRSGHPVSGSFDDYHISIDHSKHKKAMTTLKILGYTMGLGGSGWFLYMRVGGWKADALWIILAGYWLVQLARACLKLYFEYKDGQIELQEKRARYNKDYSP